MTPPDKNVLNPTDIISEHRLVLRPLAPGGVILEGRLPGKEPMKVEDLATYEQHLEAPEGPTLGWLARYGSGQAIWCGELSRADFRLQSDEVRAALRDDFGWFLVDYDLESSERPMCRVLGKVAGERAGLELMQLIIQGRLCASLDSRQSPLVDIEAPVATKCVVGGLSVRPVSGCA